MQIHIMHIDDKLVTVASDNVLFLKLKIKRNFCQMSFVSLPTITVLRFYD